MKTKKRGKYILPENIKGKIGLLRNYESNFRTESHFQNRVDIVNRIFFEKDESEWIRNSEESDWFVSSKYNRYYNLNSQKGIKAFNRLTEEEQDFYFNRCKRTIKKVYDSKNSYSFLQFYENIENNYVKDEKEKAMEYYNKFIKPDIQKEIMKLKEYEKTLSDKLKRYYRVSYFPSIVNACLFEINQSKDEIKYNLYTRTGINRFRKLSRDDKLKYINKVKEKIYNFYISNRSYHSPSTNLNKI